jgi:hypothetical protein
VYSLGAVVYELLTGRPPYTFSSLPELAEKQSAGLITPVRDLEPAVPPGVEAAVMHALARDPLFRPTSASELADELATASEVRTEPLLATALTESFQSRRYESLPGGSAWVWIAGAAAVALVAVILGVLRLGEGGGGSKTPTVPVGIPAPARGATSAAGARNLSAWLRRHSR